MQSSCKLASSAAAVARAPLFLTPGRSSNFGSSVCLSCKGGTSSHCQTAMRQIIAIPTTQFPLLLHDMQDLLHVIFSDFGLCSRNSQNGSEDLLFWRHNHRCKGYTATPSCTKLHHLSITTKKSVKGSSFSQKKPRHVSTGSNCHSCTTLM